MKRSGSGDPVGVGFVVGQRHIITAAHVVNSALGRPLGDSPGPEQFQVEFPQLPDAGNSPVRNVRVAAWSVAEDVAVLDLVGEGLPSGASPARFGSAESFTNARARVIGYPGYPLWQETEWASLQQHDRAGRQLLELDTDTKQTIRTMAGFSGAPVVVTDEEGNDLVVGMVISTSEEEGAYRLKAIPVSGLTSVWPDLVSYIEDGLSADILDRLIEGDAETAAAIAMRGENQWVELKSNLPQTRDLAKHLTAFANSDGGVLIAGVGADGRVLGWQAAEAETAAHRINGVASSILPNNTHVLQGHVGEGWLVWAVVSPSEEPAVTAEGSYWIRVLAQIRPAELPVRVPIAEDTPPNPKLSSQPGPIRVFVAMSFREEEEPALVDYWNAMLRAAKRARADFDLRRIDQIEGDYEIVERMYQEIDAAQIVIADLTLSPPNVYLELGYARGRGKHVIQTCRENTKLEFDVRGRRTLQYRNATILEEKLLCALDEL